MVDDEPAVVLVVDDEALIRMFAVEAVEEDGFIAFEASNAVEALDILEAHPEISVLFTDINMPGHDGFELARMALQRRPGIRLILTSGRMRPSKAEIPDNGRFVSKPYGMHVVRDTLAEMSGHS